MEENKKLVLLNAEEVRVLGALIEKSKATPEYYPMTINALTNACNQKSSRKPVVNYTEETVALTLNSLKILGLVSTATGASIRATKYKHNLAIVHPLLPAETAILCLLFLRGPQTPGEINTNAGRLHEFEQLEEVQQCLEKLEIEGYVTRLAKLPGQKEQRFAHLFSGEVILNEDFTENSKSSQNQQLEARIEQLEHELSDLKSKFEKLQNEWNNYIS